ncbi:MAG: DUF547 domain-containing protein [Fibrobacteres bacterium]|jgi:hypothetical protein|nr:DUF547 domain-containing protein [Fibrobacterota bacterium]
MTKILALAASVGFAGALDNLQGPWAELLSAHVKGDRVDYAGVLKEKSKLESYFKSVGAIDSNVVQSASKEERTAFYINVFNAGVFDLILKNPTKGSFFQMPGEVSNVKSFFVAAESLSLNDVLRKKIFEPTQDPRFWALVCDGSMSSAAIYSQPYNSSNLETLADERMRLWLADTLRNKFSPNKIELAQIPFDDFRGKVEFRSFPGKIPGLIKKFGPPGADAEKNRPTYFYNAQKNSIQIASSAKGKGKKKK